MISGPGTIGFLFLAPLLLIEAVLEVYVEELGVGALVFVESHFLNTDATFSYDFCFTIISLVSLSMIKVQEETEDKMESRC